MKRLHTLTAAELIEWRQERMRIGRERYGERDTGRYNLVDVVEELLDVLNILVRLENRARVQGYEFSWIEIATLVGLKNETRNLIDNIALLDKRMPDRLCTDENGGKRIWWPGEENKQEG